MQRRIQCRVSGRVQGVWYRASACTEARRLGLSGWVRNCADGSVELEAAGAESDLRELLAWLWRGPPAAEVAQVESRWLDKASPVDEPPGEFHIR